MAKDTRGKTACLRLINDIWLLQIGVSLQKVFFIMTASKQALLPKQTRVLKQVGEQIRLARLRRRLSTEQVAERAGISRPTLERLELGSHSSSIGTLLRILSVLGLEGDYLQIASDDELGRRLEDAKLTSPRKRAPKRPKPKINEDSN
ncbi:MAG TPA: helix-turn-helix transcriptional regulator [Pirellulaceae bacterium]|nr:helix-turn-helix transcriptional regulator [Pirellulaceae bacterium]